MVKFNDNSTLQAHIVRINEAIHYIEQNLDKELSLDILAKKSFYSLFHFHRIFTDLNKETPHEFVSRKRIEKTAWILLKNKKIPIAELAVQYGFNSPVSFSKSFKKHYGVSASEMRKQSKSTFNQLVHQNSKIGKEGVSVEQYFRSVEIIKKWMIAANPVITTQVLPEQEWATIRSQGSFELSDMAFEKLKKWAISKKMFSPRPMQWSLVIHDNPAITPIEKMSHSACLKIAEDHPNLHDEITVLTISKGRFLIGTFEIEEKDFKWAWGSMSIYLMNNGYAYRDGFYFEIFHGESVFEKGTKHRVDICMPID